MTTSDTDLAVREALQADVVTHATAWASRDLDTYDAERMGAGDETSLIDALKVVQLAQKKLADDRMHLTQPLEDVLDRIRSKFRPIEGRLGTAMARGKSLIRAYRVRLEREAADKKRSEDAAARLRAEQEAARGVGPSRPPVVSTAPPPANVRHGAFGVAVGRKDLILHLEDPTALLAIHPSLLEVKLKIAPARHVLKQLLREDPTAKLPGVRHEWVDAEVIR